MHCHTDCFTPVFINDSKSKPHVSKKIRLETPSRNKDSKSKPHVSKKIWQETPSQNKTISQKNSKSKPHVSKKIRLETPSQNKDSKSKPHVSKKMTRLTVDSSVSFKDRLFRSWFRIWRKTGTFCLRCILQLTNKRLFKPTSKLTLRFSWMAELQVSISPMPPCSCKASFPCTPSSCGRRY